MKASQNSFINSLKQIQTLTFTQEKLKIGTLFEILAGRGYAALLILFSFPFCLPLQIPGVSTPFGLILAFLGLRLAFGKKLWWPKWILDKELSSENVHKIVEKLLKLLQHEKMFPLKPRLTVFSKNPFFHSLNGMLIFFLGAFLSLPLPIPFTNLFSAIPLLCMGLGLLEDDGVLILSAYVLTLIGFGAFVFLFLWGKAFLAVL